MSEFGYAPRLCANTGLINRIGDSVGFRRVFLGDGRGYYRDVTHFLFDEEVQARRDVRPLVR